MNKNEARKKIKELNIRFRGELEWNNYIGWIDKSPEYRNGYGVLCDLNQLEEYCPAQHEECKKYRKRK